MMCILEIQPYKLCKNTEWVEEDLYRRQFGETEV